MAATSTETETLALDAHTFKDLEIFASETGDACLFDFCNLTRTEGGTAVLRRRMERPWCSAERIRSTQEAVGFAREQRALFEALPSAYVTGMTDTYVHEILPHLDSRNFFEFLISAFQLWSQRGSHYYIILRGVQSATRFVRALRNFSTQARSLPARGDLAPLLVELRALLKRPKLAQVPDCDIANWGGWRMLRLDQALRVHERDTIIRLLELVHEIDALVAMADATEKYDFVMPQVEEGPMRVQAEGLVHPYLDKPVANPAALNQDHRVLFLTGPNMAGKTTYLRAFATALYLAHLGMGVPARSFQFAPVQRLFSSISLTDDLRRGISYFRAEALRVKAVAEAVASGHRVVALMDEPFKGTNIKDAFDASLAILQRLVTRENCLFMFSSHLIELNSHLATAGGQVDCRYFEAVENGDRLHFDYRLRPGISDQRLGMRVLNEEGVFDLLDRKPVRQHQALANHLAQ
ncbi:hypothetical protein [Microbulbifer sp. SAOS-129_SWC]|uniref:MutS-related protein n=1 Tax=Microbulbifer sp. SAOS-129_SWC TaxID=3145235 RepID=UPI0032171E14